MIRFLEKCGVVYDEKNDRGFRLGPALVIIFLMIIFVGASLYILTSSLL